MWINCKGQLKLVQSVIDEIPKFVHRTGKSCRVIGGPSREATLALQADPSPYCRPGAGGRCPSADRRRAAVVCFPAAGRFFPVVPADDRAMAMALRHRCRGRSSPQIRNSVRSPKDIPGSSRRIALLCHDHVTGGQASSYRFLLLVFLPSRLVHRAAMAKPDYFAPTAVLDGAPAGRQGGSLRLVAAAARSSLPRG